uniref:Uncharacterized protein n=1 Tax=Caenorhabditis japonica TaxID=281687 RepID=A0A8R1IF42_CAEJA
MYFQVNSTPFSLLFLRNWCHYTCIEWMRMWRENGRFVRWNKANSPYLFITRLVDVFAKNVAGLVLFPVFLVFFFRDFHVLIIPGR